MQASAEWETVEFPETYLAVLRPAKDASPSRLALLQSLQESRVQVYDLHLANADVAVELRAWRQELEQAPAAEREAALVKGGAWTFVPDPHLSDVLDLLIALRRRCTEGAVEQRPAMHPRLAAVFDSLEDQRRLRTLRKADEVGEVDLTQQIFPTGGAALVLQELERRAIAHYRTELAAIAENARAQALRAARLGDERARQRFEELRRSAEEFVEATKAPAPNVLVFPDSARDDK